MHGREEDTGFWRETKKKRDQYEDLDNNINMDIREIEWWYKLHSSGSGK
jgi:hypothetical protein